MSHIHIKYAYLFMIDFYKLVVGFKNCVRGLGRALH